MATNGLGCLIMTAVVDQAFREQLLTAPADILSSFDLTDDEKQVLTSIQANSLTEFATELHRWLEERNPLAREPARGDTFSYPNGKSATDKDHATPASPPAAQNGGQPWGLLNSRPLSAEIARALQTSQTPHEKEGRRKAHLARNSQAEAPVPASASD